MTDTTQDHQNHDDVAAVAPTAGAVDAEPDLETEDEAADFVHPVDHGTGTTELPLEAEPAGSYVSGGKHSAVADDAIDDDEKGDYVTPVDQGEGTRTDPDGESGDYVDSDEHS